MIRKRHNRSGFTLVEIVIYMAVLFIFLLAVTQYAITMVQTAQKARTVHEVEQNARFAMERIVREIQSANGINTGSSTFASHPGVLSLSHDIAGEDPTVFDLSGGQLRITQGAGGTPYALTSNDVTVSNLVFTNLSIVDRTQNIHVAMTVTQSNVTDTAYTSTITLENSIVVREEED